MPLLILKTDLDSIQGVDKVRPILNLHPEIIDWNVDTEDIDNVLRIVANKPISESDIITLLTQYGIAIEPLNNYYKAEGYHQDYFEKDGGRNPYCVYVVKPKVEKFEKNFKGKLKKS